jgi:glycyl-tRNA synthetase
LSICPETGRAFRELCESQRSARKKLPFGVAQIGRASATKSRRKLYLPHREFEQMSLVLLPAGSDLKVFVWRAYCRDFLLSLGMKKKK